MLETCKNIIYEVLTPNGWSNFHSIKSKLIEQTIRIYFDDGSSLGCTENHLIKVNDGFIEAQWLSIGQVISGKTICKIEYVYDKIAVYDLVNVAKNNEYYTNEIISHNCEFQGSAGTLISGYILKSLTFKTPKTVSTLNGLVIHADPVVGRNYVLVADTARGRGLDYSAFVIIDVTEIPYKIVCVYKDNTISPIVFPSVIKKMGSHYNEAYVLVEINDNGQQVVDSLFDDYEYENILSTSNSKNRITLGWGFSSKTSDRGIRTTKSVKRLGCSLMKTMIESYKLIIEDFEIIAELSTFINRNNSYEAEEGSHDDLVMCLVLFSWMTNQIFFSDLCDINIKDKLYREQMERIEEEMLPLPLNGQEDFMNNRIIQDGSVWDIVN